MNGLYSEWTSHWEFTFVFGVFIVGLAWVFFEVIKTESTECGLCGWVKKLLKKE
jgi:hypothetical protein